MESFMAAGSWNDHGWNPSGSWDKVQASYLSSISVADCQLRAGNYVKHCCLWPASISHQWTQPSRGVWDASPASTRQHQNSLIFSLTPRQDQHLTDCAGREDSRPEFFPVMAEKPIPYLFTSLLLVNTPGESLPAQLTPPRCSLNCERLSWRDWNCRHNQLLHLRKQSQRSFLGYLCTEVFRIKPVPLHPPSKNSMFQSIIMPRGKLLVISVYPETPASPETRLFVFGNTKSLFSHFSFLSTCGFGKVASNRRLMIDSLPMQDEETRFPYWHSVVTKLLCLIWRWFGSWGQCWHYCHLAWCWKAWKADYTEVFEGGFRTQPWEHYNPAQAQYDLKGHCSISVVSSLCLEIFSIVQTKVYYLF